MKHKFLYPTIGILLLIIITTSVVYLKSERNSEKLADITLAGTVVKNYQGCFYDNDCVLTVQLDDGRQISAIYVSGLTPTGACYQSSGFELVPGDQVELRGAFTDQGTYSLCGGGSYIKKVGSTQSYGWELYTNNQYGFEFEYPENWQIPATVLVGNPDYEKDNIVSVQGPNRMLTDVGGSFDPIFMVRLYDNTDEIPPIAKYLQALPEEINQSTKSTKVGEWTVQETNYESFAGEGASAITYQVQLNKDNKVYILQLSYTLAGCSQIHVDLRPQCKQKNNALKNKSDQVWNQILSTFKFSDLTNLFLPVMPLFEFSNGNPAWTFPERSEGEYYYRDWENEVVYRVKGYKTVGIATIKDDLMLDLRNHYDLKLTSYGWEQDPKFGADGPYGSIWGHKRGGQRIIFEWRWEGLRGAPIGQSWNTFKIISGTLQQ